MATLTRPKVASRQAPESLLATSVPTPFPVPERERFLREELTNETDINEVTEDDNVQQQEAPNEVQVSAFYIGDSTSCSFQAARTTAIDCVGSNVMSHDFKQPTFRPYQVDSHRP
jgi:hypothetical protein